VREKTDTNGKIGGLSAVSLVWCYFRIPETKGRTYEELDLMFEKGLRTREFKNYKFD
jgi:SP family general alpha glucoside:H+ symporter-like MFS transporter